MGPSNALLVLENIKLPRADRSQSKWWKIDIAIKTILRFYRTWQCFSTLHNWILRKIPGMDAFFCKVNGFVIVVHIWTPRLRNGDFYLKIYSFESTLHYFFVLTVPRILFVLNYYLLLEWWALSSFPKFYF